MKSKTRGRQEHPRTNLNLLSCEPRSSRLRGSGPAGMMQPSGDVHRPGGTPGEEAALIRRQGGGGGR